MSRKRLAIIIIIVAVVAGGAAFALKSSGGTGTTEQAATDDTSAQPAQTASQPNSPGGSYITLADYNAAKSDYGNDKKVLFFHAPWCPVCQSIDKAINADPSKIPSGDVIIKTDFDSQTDLRKKYGVTYQYTFVQIDNSGQQIKQWSATTLDDVISKIE